MTVSSIEPVNNYTGNSSNKTFDFDFLIESEKELVVQHTDCDGKITILQNRVDYLINEINNPNGSYITFPISGSTYDVLTHEETLSLILKLEIKQENEFRNSLFFNFETMEWMFDYIIRNLQILDRKIKRCVKVEEGSGQTADDLFKSLQNAQVNAVNANEAAQQALVNVLNSESSINMTYENFTELSNSAINAVNSGKSDIALDVSSGITQIQNLAQELGENYFEKADTSLLNLTASGNAKLQYAPFAINNGMVLNGENNTLTSSGMTITCAPCTITTCDGRTKTFKNAAVLDVTSQSDGEYSIFKDFETGALDFVLKSDFSIGKTNLSPVFVDTSEIPVNLYVNDVINNDLVYIGDFTVENGSVSAITNRLFNDSGYLVASSVMHYLMLPDYQNPQAGALHNTWKTVNKSSLVIAQYGIGSIANYWGVLYLKDEFGNDIGVPVNSYKRIDAQDNYGNFIGTVKAIVPKGYSYCIEAAGTLRGVVEYPLKGVI